MKKKEKTKLLEYNIKKLCCNQEERTIWDYKNIIMGWKTKKKLQVFNGQPLTFDMKEKKRKTYSTLRRN